MTFRRRFVSALAAGLFLVLPTSIIQAAPAVVPSSSALDLGSIDTSVNPCDDFYQYANGKWLAATTIPAEYGSWSSFSIVYEHNLAVLHGILETAAADKTASAGSTTGKVGSYYRSFMDVDRIEAAGITPLAPEFARIVLVTNVPSLLTEVAHLHRIGVDAAFGFGVEQDPGHSDDQIASVGQGGLGLPERGYYDRTDKDSQAIRDDYVAHVTKMFALLNEPSTQASADAATVLTLETKLAGISKYPVDLRDTEANYHKMTLAGLDALTPGVNWQPYFTGIGLAEPSVIDVSQPAFFTGLGGLLTSTPITDWQTYLRWQLITAEASGLSSAFDEENFHFYGTVLRGTPQQSVRWKRGVQATDGRLGQALGKLYVAAVFPPAAKARALALVTNLKAVLGTDLGSLPWMSPATRKEALVKLDAMRIKIGYPDHWRDYSKLDVSSPDYITNKLKANEFEFQRQLNKVGKPVDHTEWGMSPPTVNAYYSPSMNDINFPAGILQTPFFNADADDAVNYGAIGMVIGHEMTHGFDDQGRKFDAHGNLRDWWTADDATRFGARAQGIVTQYSGYEPLPGQHINGALTQGENIADIGGLKIAYLALERDLQGKPRTLIDGYTPEQRFFLSFAQLWRELARPTGLKAQLLTDPHSPNHYRVLGPLADMPEFRQAFHCPLTPKASPTTIW